MITSNIDQVIGKMNARGFSVQAQLIRSAQAMAPVLERVSKAVLQSEIYDIPEKRSSSGRMLWVRSGILMGAEAAMPNGADVELVNLAPYAAARYHLGDPLSPTRGPSGPRQVRPPQRSVQWHRNVIASRRGYVLEERRKAVERGLRDATPKAIPAIAAAAEPKAIPAIAVAAAPSVFFSAAILAVGAASRLARFAFSGTGRRRR